MRESARAVMSQREGLSRRSLVLISVACLGTLGLFLFVLQSGSGIGSGNFYSKEVEVEVVEVTEVEEVEEEVVVEERSAAPTPKPKDEHAGWPSACYELWMTDVDRRAFVDMLVESEAQQYLEWGGGSSTLCAAALVDHVTTIEHNVEWCNKLKQKIEGAKITNVNVICSPVEWVLFGDVPEGDGTYDEFAAYVDAVDSVGIAHFDVVFIDGRARPSCARKALDYITNDSLVMVHDWDRQHYHEPVLALYDERKTIRPLDVLALLRKKTT